MQRIANKKGIDNLFSKFAKICLPKGLIIMGYKTDTSNYGKTLAKQVADALERKRTMILAEHQCYCGIGFDIQSGNYNLCRVYDEVPLEILISFNNKEKFIDWLSLKNDFSMSGSDPNDEELYEKTDFYRNNQRITKQDLIKFVR